MPNSAFPISDFQEPTAAPSGPELSQAGGGRAPCAGRQPHGTRPHTVPGSGERPRALETLNIPRVRHSSCSQCLLAVHSPGIPPCLQALALSCFLHRMEPTPGSPLGPRSSALPPPRSPAQERLAQKPLIIPFLSLFFFSKNGHFPPPGSGCQRNNILPTGAFEVRRHRPAAPEESL